MSLFKPLFEMVRLHQKPSLREIGFSNVEMRTLRAKK